MTADVTALRPIPGSGGDHQRRAFGTLVSHRRLDGQRDDCLGREQRQLDPIMMAESMIQLPIVGNKVSTASAPDGRFAHTAVWTGSKMIVWGGVGGSSHNTGGRYDPTTDSWTPTSTASAPEARYNHTAVWTGSEMIVWGGWNNDTFFNTGGRYDPSTDSWTATSTTNAPEAREHHTAVWTGSEMIVWGGSNSVNGSNTGGKYDPNTDSWMATSTANAPSSRYLHTVVWTGDEMIVISQFCGAGPRSSTDLFRQRRHVAKTAHSD